jgi:hypothetical protein
VATYRTVDGETPCRCREARPDTDGALDVERLASVLMKMLPGGPWMTRKAAVEIATEYARLSRPTDGETP